MFLFLIPGLESRRFRQNWKGMKRQKGIHSYQGLRYTPLTNPNVLCLCYKPNVGLP